MDHDRPTIRKIYSLMVPKLSLNQIYHVSQQQSSQNLGGQGSTSNSMIYIFRGMIVYYGRHYWAYFYSQKFDAWFQFDDAKITRIGNWEDVCDRCVRGKAIPRTLFYEKQDLLISMLLDGDRIRGETDMMKIYCSDSQMDQNNFWTGRAGGKKNSSCTTF